MLEQVIPLGVAALALLGTLFTLWSNRRKATAEATMTDAQRQKLQDEIAAGLRKDLLDADTNCDKRIKLLEAAREQDQRECGERLGSLEQEIVVLRSDLATAVAWGKQVERESCERTTRLETKVTDLTELLNAREEELAEIVRGIERETSR